MKPTPTAYEDQIAAAVVEAAALGEGTAAYTELRALVAEALAHHRARAVRLALALIPHPSAPSEQALDHMAEGWTPRQVHELISAYRATLIQLRRTRELLPAALGERSTT